MENNANLPTGSAGEGGGRGLPEIEREYIEWRKTHLNGTGDAWEAFKAAWERSRAKAVGSLDALREAAKASRLIAHVEKWLRKHDFRANQTNMTAAVMAEKLQAAAALLERSSVSGPPANRPESLKWYCVNCQKLVPVTITHGDMVCACGMVIASGAAGQGEG